MESERVFILGRRPQSESLDAVRSRIQCSTFPAQTREETRPCPPVCLDVPSGNRGRGQDAHLEHQPSWGTGIVQLSGSYFSSRAGPSNTSKPLPSGSHCGFMRGKSFAGNSSDRGQDKRTGHCGVTGWDAGCYYLRGEGSSEKHQ